MSGEDLVRGWKDSDDHGYAAHPAGEINLDDLSGGIAFPWPIDRSFWWPACQVESVLICHYGFES